ncbi:hypothetical protein J2I47_10985 [Fibrella sp. HMF5335]|uniref:Uncharacterized protein n=1 Tax=Fibrella rubiginis TaxID=2817060 RepID=A0A939GGJ1_9BACT|nr:hypothetical protein [Fibrella rubiginis]MBO0937070.1 hypothetical protein [Fibrella rubiginis]
MSFYDNIRIDSAQLPLTPADVERLGAGVIMFQTKSLEDKYGVYNITSEGYLETVAAMSAKGWESKTRWHEVRLVDAHGYIVFYTVVDDHWFCFKARFREGRMTEVFRLGHRPEVHSRTCTWELEIPLDELKSAYDAEVIRHELSQLDARERAHVETELADFEQQFPNEEGQ